MDTCAIQSAYKKEKEAKVAQKATAKVTRVVETRSSRTGTLVREVGKNKATQRNLRSSTKSTVVTAKLQSSIEFGHVITKGEKALEVAAVANDDQQPSSCINEDSTQTEAERVTTKDPQDKEPLPKKSEETSDDPATNEHPVRPARAQNDIPKLVAEDTIFQERPRRSEDDLDDNIHPLARTVVTVAPRTYPRKVHDEEPSIDHHKIETRISTSTPSRMSRKATVQKPTTDASLPLPSHLDALFANFKALESIHVFTKRQGQLCFYHKLKKHVELQSLRYDP